jgi:HK97 family phage major capsid protein
MAIDLQPTATMAEEAERGLAWREEFGRGGTAVGVARARDIKNRVTLSPETVRRMVSYFARHEVDKQGAGWSPGEDGYPSAGRIAWALWGGDPGRAWANEKDRLLDAEESEGRNMDQQRHIVAVVEDEATVTITFEKSVMDMDESEEAEAAIEAVEEAAEDEAELVGERPKDMFGNEPWEEDYAGPAKRKGPEKRVFRSAVFERESVQDADRRVSLAFSSEAAVERGWGMEVLDHSPGAIDSSFIGSGRAPLLVDHDPADQIGVVEMVSLGSDRVARAVVRFGKSQRAEEIWQDVKDGIRGNVSVGYVINEMVSDGKRDGREVYRATSWSPLEISIVSIPADTSVGVGRSMAETPKPEVISHSPKVQIMSEINSEAVREDGMKAERSRVSAIMDLASRHNQRDLGESAVREGATIEQFRGALLDKVASKPLNVDVEVGLSDREARSFSFVKAIRALSNPQDRRAQDDARFEFEVSEAAAKKEGRDSRGITVPVDVLKRDLTTSIASGTSKAGNLVATDLLAGSFIDVLRNKMVLNTLGAQFLTGLQGNVAIPRKTAGATSYWVGENSAPTEGNMTFDQVTLSPKTLAAYVDYSRRLMLQSSMDVETMVRNDLAASIAVAMDAAAISGSGSNRPTGILNTSGIGSVTLGTNGGAPTWAMVTGLVKEVEIDNALTGAAAFLTNGQVKAKLASTPKQTSGVEGNFLLGPDVNSIYGYPLVVSQQIPGNLSKGSASGTLSAMIFGVWSDLLVGQWSGIDLMADPYTGSNAGTVRIVAFHDCDFAVRHVESFAECNEIVTA